MKSPTLGVIVARFQVPDLSEGHRFLIESVLAMHEKVLIVLGDTPARLTQSAPMPFELRRLMVKAMYPQVGVAHQMDQPNDELWSSNLDTLITAKGGGSLGAILYGGRDSFIPHYKGMYRVVQVAPVDCKSGEEIRRDTYPRDTSDFRAGVVWASKWKYPVSFQCVDMAVVGPEGWVLCAKKSNDAGFRFPGGFVDPTDPSLEHAALREIREETGIEPGTPTYIGSFRIADYRYRKAEDSIMTALFLIPYLFGAPIAGDDIAEVSWQRLDDETRARMLPHYVPLFDAVRAHMEKKNAQ